jgi:hypothetical protein
MEANADSGRFCVLFLRLSPAPTQKFMLIFVRLCVHLPRILLCPWSRLYLGRSCPLLHTWSQVLVSPNLLHRLLPWEACQWSKLSSLDPLWHVLLDPLCSSLPHHLMHLHIPAQGFSMGFTNPRFTLMELCGMDSS